MSTQRSRLPRGLAATAVALGLVYLALLAGFALASPWRPPALGWLGFAIVGAVVVGAMWATGELLARSDREPE